VQTTQLYVELIIIGLQGSLGLFLLAICLFGWDKVQKAFPFFAYTSSVVLLIGFFYLLGLFIDRFADLLMKNEEKELRAEKSIKTHTLLLLNDNKQTEFLHYTRNRMRVLRASTVTVPFITMFAIVCVWTEKAINPLYASGTVMILGALTFCLSRKSYLSLQNRYYDAVKTIEDDYLAENSRSAD